MAEGVEPPTRIGGQKGPCEARQCAGGPRGVSREAHRRRKMSTEDEVGRRIEGSHRPWGALRRSFATLASANRAEIAPRTGRTGSGTGTGPGTVGKVTSLPFSSFMVAGARGWRGLLKTRLKTACAIHKGESRQAGRAPPHRNPYAQIKGSHDQHCPLEPG